METGYKTLADFTPGKDKTVAIIINQQEAFSGLLSTGYKTAEIQKAYLVIFVTTAEALNSWLHIPEEYDPARIVIEYFSDISSVGSILKHIKRFRPILLGLQMNTDKKDTRYLPGVAIAVALVPPLATVGVCLSIGFWSLSLGAFKLFLSNTVGIVFASALVFASFGFKPNLDNTKDQRKINVFQRSIVASAALVVVMLLLLVTRAVEEVREANIDDEVQEEITAYLTDLKLPASVDRWSMTAASSGTTKFELRLEATRQLTAAEVDSLRKRMEQTLGTSVSLDLELISLSKISSQ